MSTNARPILSRPMPSPDAIAALGDIDPLHARLFAMRGLTEAAQLDYGLARLAPVSRLDNIDEAAELVIANRDRRIVVVGDFDVDGATSTALILRCLREFGFSEVDYLVPNRFEYGYGLTPEIVRVAAESRPALLVTVDNGISSLDGVAEANRLGIPVLVTDHHLPGDALPDAAVIVNPNLPESSFPSKSLAGVGVASTGVAPTWRACQAAYKNSVDDSGPGTSTVVPRRVPVRVANASTLACQEARVRQTARGTPVLPEVLATSHVAAGSAEGESAARAPAVPGRRWSTTAVGPGRSRASNAASGASSATTRTPEAVTAR